MKRFVLLAATAIAIAAAGSVSVIAQPQGFGRGPGRGMGPGGPGPMGVLQRLDLTDEQRTEIKALLEERKAEAPEQKVMDLQKQLHEAIFAATPDTAKISEIKTAIDAAASEALDDRVALQLKIAQVLTPEQREKARAFEGRRGGARPWGRRP